MSAGMYDAIVVGARCAGSPTAMLLARKGYRVLLLDKATFPSDTMSTHFVHPPGVAALERWGLLDRLEATGCPRVDTYSFDFGPVTISGSPRPVDGIGHGFCPRRTVLDELLVDAAVEAGAELREGFTVDEVLKAEGTVTAVSGHHEGAPTGRPAHAPVVIGADGRHSVVVKNSPPRGVRRAPVAPSDVLRLLERPAHRGLRDHRVGRSTAGAGPPSRPTTTSRSSPSPGPSTSFGPTAPRSRRPSSRRSSTPPSSPSWCTRPRASRSWSARPSCRGGPASRTAPGGRSSATPGTTRTRSRPWASTTPSATPSCSRTPSTTPCHGGAGGARRCPTTSARATPT